MTFQVAGVSCRLAAALAVAGATALETRRVRSRGRRKVLLQSLVENGTTSS
jgi:hypothetical protein